MMRTIELLIDLGFKINRPKNPSTPTKFSYNFGNLMLTAQLLLDEHFNPKIGFSGVELPARLVNLAEFELPMEVASYQQGVAMIVSQIWPGFAPMRPTPWFDDGGRWQMHLPINRERDADEQTPKYDKYLQLMESQLIGYKMIFEATDQRVGLDTPWPEHLTEDEVDLLKSRLRSCMPSNGMITDLWDWDVDFAELLEDDWYYAAIFGDVGCVENCAQRLADFFQEKATEYDMDYDQSGDPEWFSDHVREEATKFVLGWRRKVSEVYGFGAAPAPAPAT